MKIRLALAAATCLALPAIVHSSAHAQPVSGPYVSLAGGTSILAPVNSKLEGTDIPSGVSVLFKNEFHNDYAGLGGVGYGFGNGFRVELDGDFIRNTASHGTFTETYNEDGISYGEYFNGKNYGAEEKYGPMLNLLYDVPVPLPVTPYVGGGVGYQWVKFDRDLKQDVIFNEDFSNVSGTKGSFALDAIFGAAYPLPMLPQLAITGEYRFMFLPEARKFSAEFIGGGANSTYVEKFDQESSHTFLVGLRYTLFGPGMISPAPTPAPAASPAPAAAKTYLVFFDWDKYSLTPRATQIIAEAASDSKTSSVTTIDVSGYTDTSGTPTYNQGLSERRAKAVAAKLVADGVPASEISIHAYGETHLLVPTGPGVREPQNRRVEIVLN